MIYHDFLVGETGIDAPVHTLTLDQVYFCIDVGLGLECMLKISSIVHVNEPTADTPIQDMLSRAYLEWRWGVA